MPKTTKNTVSVKIPCKVTNDKGEVTAEKKKFDILPIYAEGLLAGLNPAQTKYFFLLGLKARTNAAVQKGIKEVIPAIIKNQEDRDLMKTCGATDELMAKFFAGKPLSIPTTLLIEKGDLVPAKLMAENVTLAAVEEAADEDGETEEEEVEEVKEEPKAKANGKKGGK